jgi:hypothetical protein
LGLVAVLSGLRRLQAGLKLAEHCFVGMLRVWQSLMSGKYLGLRSRRRVLERRHGFHSRKEHRRMLPSVLVTGRSPALSGLAEG